ncbi:MAG TPA: hypothetical protein VMU72_10305 [Gaiellaceae bacterium]|nr:hypothetical protein [Gaiellaceae bacterium]
MNFDADTSIGHGSAAERSTAQSVAGYLSSLAIFVSFLGIFWHPLRLIVPSLLVALVASGMARGRLQLAAVLIGAVCFVLGLALAVATGHALW